MNPARQAMVPSLVPDSLLARALGLTNMTWQLGTIIGPSLAGLVLAARGPALVYLLDGFTYAVLVVALAVLRIPATGRKGSAAVASVWVAMAEGARYVRRRPIIWSLCGPSESVSSRRSNSLT